MMSTSVLRCGAAADHFSIHRIEAYFKGACRVFVRTGKFDAVKTVEIDVF